MSNRRLTSRDYKSAHRGAFSLLRWREFLAGLALGLIVALVVYINFRRAAQPEEAPVPPPRAAAPSSAPEAGATATDPTDFSFYSRLASAQVMVPEKERSAETGRGGKVDKPGTYWLQIGAYRDIDEAERARAKLARLDITAAIQRVSVDDEVWHRVRIGPISNLAELEQQRARLARTEFKADVLRGVSQ